MNPYAVLGLPDSATIEQAKAAYRKLAMEHHPDRGGNEARFKEIKAAWETIERGWTPPPPYTEPSKAKSSFSDAPKSKAQGRTDRPKGPHAGKPAPGYEARGTPPMPRTSRKLNNGRDRYEIDITITQDQAFEGCVVPFIHQGKVLDYEVRPGTGPRTETISFPLEQMIGANRSFADIVIHLTVQNKKSAPNEQTRDAEIVVNLCALGLFIGGKITVVDHLGEKIPVRIPMGYDPSTPIEVAGYGFGLPGARGALHVKINPIFKPPSELNSHELAQLQHLNIMAKK